MKYDLTRCELSDQDEIARLLKVGWEPFAVTREDCYTYEWNAYRERDETEHTIETVYHFRRQVKLP